MQGFLSLFPPPYVHFFPPVLSYQKIMTESRPYAYKIFVWILWHYSVHYKNSWRNTYNHFPVYVLFKLCCMKKDIRKTIYNTLVVVYLHCVPLLTHSFLSLSSSNLSLIDKHHYVLCLSHSSLIYPLFNYVKSSYIFISFLIINSTFTSVTIRGIFVTVSLSYCRPVSPVSI